MKMNSFKTDVLVIGAGPAGSVAAAMLHKKGLKVKVVEKQQFPRFVIGESLLPRCMDAFEEADLLDAIKACGFQEKFGAKFMKDDAICDFNFSQGFTPGFSWTWQVTRADFDKALTDSLQQRGIEIDFQTGVEKIEFAEDGYSKTTVVDKDGNSSVITARYIIDASGYGRVIPRMFDLDKPSGLDPRKAVFVHIQDNRRLDFEEPSRILIIVYAPGTWVWVIPFSNGTTSLGFVGSMDYFEKLDGDLNQQFRTLVKGNKYLRERFQDQELVFEPRKLEAWSIKTKKFHGNGFVLAGNATEFLDPVFSSGVMFAAVSGHLAANLVVKKLQGAEVDWETEYTDVMQQGVDTFRSYVNGWYDGTLEKIFFHNQPNEEIKKKICSVLAGYVWDMNNPFVQNHSISLRNVSKFIDFQIKMAELSR